jgi:hypothetical protein
MTRERKLCGCGRLRDKEGQRYARVCHAAYMRTWRQRRTVREMRYAESVERLREELAAFQTQEASR